MLLSVEVKNIKGEKSMNNNIINKLKRIQNKINILLEDQSLKFSEFNGAKTILSTYNLPTNGVAILEQQSKIFDYNKNKNFIPFALSSVVGPLEDYMKSKNNFSKRIKQIKVNAAAAAIGSTQNKSRLVSWLQSIFNKIFGVKKSNRLLESTEKVDNEVHKKSKSFINKLIHTISTSDNGLIAISTFSLAVVSFIFGITNYFAAFTESGSVFTGVKKVFSIIWKNLIETLKDIAKIIKNAITLSPIKAIREVINQVFVEGVKRQLRLLPINTEYGKERFISCVLFLLVAQVCLYISFPAYIFYYLQG